MRTRTGICVLIVVLALMPFGTAQAAFKPCLNATIRGTMFDDFLLGTGGRDIIRGYGGDDIILGLGGNDILCGNRGEDSLNGGDGEDLAFGGAATDRCTAEYKELCERGGA